MRKVLFALILSVFVHLLLATGLLVYPVPQPLKDSAIVEIQITDKRPASHNETNRQIVREALIPEKLKTKESEDPRIFLSSQTQRVKTETRAAVSGKTENQSSNAKKEAPAPVRTHGGRGGILNREQLLAAAAEAARGTPTRTSNKRRENVSTSKNSIPTLTNSGVSTIGDVVPDDVEIGSFTALNTDRYLFYSFYARIEDLIRFRWESSVKNALEVTPRARLAASVRSRWTTQMEVQLNARGELQKVLIMKESGLPAFDQAATQAFTEARYFPNPPTEMVEEDGLIHLKYSFTVYYDPQILARP